MGSDWEGSSASDNALPKNDPQNDPDYKNSKYYPSDSSAIDVNSNASDYDQNDFGSDEMKERITSLTNSIRKRHIDCARISMRTKDFCKDLQDINASFKDFKKDILLQNHVKKKIIEREKMKKDKDSEMEDEFF